MSKLEPPLTMFMHIRRKGLPKIAPPPCRSLVIANPIITGTNCDQTQVCSSEAPTTNSGVRGAHDCMDCAAVLRWEFHTVPSDNKRRVTRNMCQTSYTPRRLGLGTTA